MEILRIALTVLFCIDCAFLTGVVLMQEGKGNGLGSLAGGQDTTYWGKNKGRSKEGKLALATKVMGALFVVLALVLNLNF